MPERRTLITLVAAVIGVVAVAVVLFLVFSRSDDDVAGSGATIAPADLVRRTAEYAGETVTVTDRVGQVIDPRTFTLGSEDDVLVTGSSRPVKSGDRVEVRGVFRSRDRGELENKLGLINDQQLRSLYPPSNVPTLSATSVSTRG